MSFFEAIQPGGPAYDPTGARFGGQKLYDFAAAQNKAQNIAAGPHGGGYQVQAPRGGAANYSAPATHHAQQGFNPFHSAITSMLAAPKPTPPPPPPRSQTDPLGIMDILTGKSDNQDPLQQLSKATAGLFGDIPNAKPGGLNAKDIPNAPPGPVQTQNLLDPNTSINTEGDFAKALLQNLGAPASPGNIDAIVRQEQAEEGNWTGTPTPDRFNPLNTGQGGFGGVETQAGGQGSGLQAFPNWASGVDATAATLRDNASPMYGPAVQALKSNDPAGYLRDIAASGWAGSGYNGGNFPAANPQNLQLSPQAAKGNFPTGPYNHPADAIQAAGSNIFPSGTQVQWGRTDQGIDGQLPPGTPVNAADSGTISIQHDPSGFGDNYAVLNLDRPINVQGQNYSQVYYGHLYPTVKDGTRVPAGAPIAQAGAQGGGNAAGEPGGFEIGFAQGGSPAPGAGGAATSYFKGAPSGAGSSGGTGGSTGGGGVPAVGPQAAQVAQQLPLMAMALSQPNQSFDPLSILMAGANSEPGQSKQDQDEALSIMTGDNGG